MHSEMSIELTSHLILVQSVDTQFAREKLELK